MKKISIFTTLALVILFASAAYSQQKVSYKISGDMAESCACQMLCPCSVGEDARNPNGCQASIVMRIASGNYGETKLDGLNVIAMLLKPEKNLGVAIGKLEGGLYIDVKANEAQRQALAAIITDQFGAMFGKVAGPKFVPISFSKSMTDAEGLADEYSAEIPNVLSFKIAAIKNQAGKRSAHMNMPMGFLPVEYVAKGITHKYNDKEWATMWDFVGKDAFYGKFEMMNK